MSEKNKKSSWEIPPPGPGTISGFFVAWAFVAGVIGITIILMVIGKGPMPLRVAAYDLGLDGIAPGQVEAIMAQTTPWVQRAGAKGDVLRKVMLGELEISKAAEQLKIKVEEVAELLREPRVISQKFIRGELALEEAAGRLGVAKEAKGKKDYSEAERYAEGELKRLTAAIGQVNPMVLVLNGTSEKLTKELSRKLELSHFLAKGSSAILSKYPVFARGKPGEAFSAVIRYGKNGRFGVINAATPSGRVKSPTEELGRAPHAIFLSASEAPPEPYAGYVNATVENEPASNWLVSIPKTIEGNLEECYVPADNKIVKAFSDRLPIVARFVFRSRDFE